MPRTRSASWDGDLLTPDSILTEAALDSMWQSFNSATEEGMDRRLIFIKLVNAVRKPYQIATHAQQDSEPSKREENHRSTPNNTTGADTRTSENLGAKWCGEPENQLPRVAIMSASATKKFVSLNGENVNPFEMNGTGGSIDIALTLTTSETFELEQYQNNEVAFQSSVYRNVYMAVGCNSQELNSTNTARGGDTLNCQYVRTGTGLCWENTRFKIRTLQGFCSAEIAFESVAFPGRYLSLDPGKKKATLHGSIGHFEKFHLLSVLR
ncbi:hypothetical protein BDZ91DRAFT_747050 [Kalaharituber pfeilii]|nr:hypothetical protein BDZ91DRAFT_747050 [Kalaharituber pfeilii]